MRRWSKVASACVRPSFVGALYVTALVAATARAAAREERVMGVRAPAVAEAITRTFHEHVREAAIVLGASAVVLGLALGAIAGALARTRARLAGRPAPRGARLALASVVPLVVLHAGAVAVGMARRPQLYSETFYDVGGVERLAQVVVTDTLGPIGSLAVGALAIALYVIGAPRGWRVGAERARAGAARRPRALMAAALVSAAALVAAPTGRVKRTRPAGAPPDVIILAADSLRPDHITARVAPRLTAFAERAVRFDDAQVSIARTFPSWVTWLTGRYPHHHGVRTMFPSRAVRAREFDALPARFASAGYRTAVVSDYAGDIFPRIELGFERVVAPTFHFGELIRQRALERQTALLPFLDTRLGRALVPSLDAVHRAADADGVARKALAELDAAGDRPVFLVAFFSTTHFPYAAPYPGYSAFTDRSYRGRFKYEKAYRLGDESPPDDDDVRHVRALYDGAVNVVDGAVGAVLDGIDARGAARDTVVVVMADHGETLFEAGRGHGHGDHLFGDESLRAPLFIRDGRAPRAARVAGVVRDIDLAPTLYELARVPPPGDLDGASLAPALDGAPLESRNAFAETGIWFTEEPAGVPRDMRLAYPDVSQLTEVLRDHGDDIVLRDEAEPLTIIAKHRALTTSARRYVLMPTRRGLIGELFDRAGDPLSLHDRSATEPALAASMRETLLHWVELDPLVELRDSHLVPRPGAFDRRALGTDDAFRLAAP